jgi:hypothetical protein
MRQRIPGAIELVYDDFNALAIGYGPSERASDALISLAVYSRWLNLYFLHGANLPDPDGLLKGSGRQGRYVRLESVDAIDTPAIRALIDAAIETSRVPMVEAQRGRAIIKSVSAKQRPRRPDPGDAERGKEASTP